MKRKVIIAEDGMWITDGKGFYKEVDLGDWDSEENYTKVTEEEYKRQMGDVAVE